MSHIDFENPEFTTAIRGYDKLQVDDYLERLQEHTADAEERARTAESELEFNRHTNVGPRVTEILDLAVAESKELRERAAAEAEKIRNDARRKAGEITARAEKEKAKIRERSEREAEEAHEAIEAERRRSELAIAQLQDTKEALVTDLRQIHETLARAAGLANEVAPQPALEESLGDADTVQHEVALPPPVPRSNVA